MTTSLANIIYKAFILSFLWSILKNVDPSFTEISLWANIVVTICLGIVSGLSDIGNPK